MVMMLYFCCSQERRSESEAIARALLLAVGEQKMDVEGRRWSSSYNASKCAYFYCTHVCFSSVACTCNTRDLWSFFLAADHLLVSRGQLTYRDSRRHPTWSRDARANSDEITDYWIKCNSVLTGPADKTHAGFERTYPGFKHRMGLREFTSTSTVEFKLWWRFRNMKSAWHTVFKWE